jgi:hypothetical protein
MKCLLVELDYKALEAQLVGVLAKDPYYLRASKLGVHSILMSHVIGSPISLDRDDAYIKNIGKELKRSDPVGYDACKHVVHMSNYLGTPKRIRMEFPDHFPSVGDAKKKQDIYFSTIAKKVRVWQQLTLNRAFEQHWLENVYGYRHYFWDALHYMGHQLEWGTDAKRAVAFVPQSTGAGLLSEALLRIKSWFPDVFKMIRWIIHDSIVAEIPINKLAYAIGVLKYCMEIPEPRLEGLSVEVEISIGENWGEMKDYEGEIEEIVYDIRDRV